MCVACVRQPASTRLYAIGETAEVDGWRITVHGFQALPADRYYPPAEAYSLCAVELTLENASRLIRFMMPEKQMLLESDGRAYAPDRNASVMAARLHGWMVPEGELNLGAKVHGAASYQIPSASQDVRWTFRAGLFPWSRSVTFVLGKLPTP
jgi:hypothetical protein